MLQSYPVSTPLYLPSCLPVYCSFILPSTCLHSPLPILSSACLLPLYLSPTPLPVSSPSISSPSISPHPLPVLAPLPVSSPSTCLFPPLPVSSPFHLSRFLFTSPAPGSSSLFVRCHHIFRLPPCLDLLGPAPLVCTSTPPTSLWSSHPLYPSLSPPRLPLRLTCRNLVSVSLWPFLSVSTPVQRSFTPSPSSCGSLPPRPFCLVMSTLRASSPDTHLVVSRGGRGRGDVWIEEDDDDDSSPESPWVLTRKVVSG